jgi:hypothetical protein
MNGLGLATLFDADLMEYVGVLAKAPQTTVLLQYESGPKGPHVFVVVCIAAEPKAKEAHGWASFIFHEADKKKLARAFADELFSQTQKSLEATKGN